MVPQMLRVIPTNTELLITVVAFTGVFEFLRIIIAYLLASPSSEIGKLEAKLLETQLDVSKIKSVQLEFVKHSKLSRELIKLEKQIETIKDKDAPKAKQVAYIFQMIRIAAYVGAGVYFFNDAPAVVICPKVFWPLSWFMPSDEVSVSSIVMFFVFGSAFRHLFRTMLPLIFTRATFP